MIPKVSEELGCYHWVKISLNLIKEDGVDNREDHVSVEPDTDDEEIKDVVLNDERERHWRMVFEDNKVGVDETKALLHARKWDV